MSLFIDLLAISSLIGIWPRFIEPRLLKTTQLQWELNENEAHLEGLKILHITDLHYHASFPKKFLKKISTQTRLLKPDLILFTGDFICGATLNAKENLKKFLCELEAPLGSYCSFGNHDYAHYATLNSEGAYDLLPPISPLKGIGIGLKTLFSSPPPKMGIRVTERAKAIPLHEELCALLAQTPFTILENKTITLPIGLNVTGLGDLALGRCHPSQAFNGYQTQFPGLVLSHNPDSAPELCNYPGNWLFCGHTHGEQIHLPWPKWGRRLTQKLARLENTTYTRGLIQLNDKKMYVNRGLGCHKPFRLFSPPELCLIQAIKTKK